MRLPSMRPKSNPTFETTKQTTAQTRCFYAKGNDSRLSPSHGDVKYRGNSHQDFRTSKSLFGTLVSPCYPAGRKEMPWVYDHCTWESLEFELARKRKRRGAKLSVYSSVQTFLMGVVTTLSVPYPSVFLFVGCIPGTCISSLDSYRRAFLVTVTAMFQDFQASKLNIYYCHVCVCVSFEALPLSRPTFWTMKFYAKLRFKILLCAWLKRLRTGSSKGLQKPHHKRL